MEVAVCGSFNVWELYASLLHLVEVSHQNLAYLSLKRRNLGLAGDKLVARRINHIHIVSFL